MKLFTIKLSEKDKKIFSMLAKRRESSLAATFRWLLSEAARVYGILEPEEVEKNDNRSQYQV